MNDFLNSALYQKIHNYLPIVCVDIVIKTPNNKFLMLKRKKEPAKNKWWLVGGRVFKNESLESAAQRKVQEETGLEVETIEKIVEGYELILKEDPFGHGNGTHAICTCFSAFVNDLSILKLDKYHSDFKIFEYYDNQWDSYLINCLSLAGFSSN